MGNGFAFYVSSVCCQALPRARAASLAHTHRRMEVLRVTSAQLANLLAILAAPHVNSAPQATLLPLMVRAPLNHALCFS